MTTRARRLSCNVLVVLTAVFTLLLSHAQALSWTEQTTPATDQLRDVWAADGANIWVVGNGGRIVKGDGSGNWAAQTSGVTNPLIEVWGTSATNLWAVGGSGRILRGDGTAWTTQTSGTTQALFSLWGSSASNVWAAGDNSTLTRWNGTSWTVSNLGVGTNVLCNGLWGSAANNIWLVGTHINTGNGRVYRYNGTAWSEDTSMGTVAGLNDVWGTSASDVWAVGNGGLILRWNGTAWSTSPSGTTQDLLSIWGSSATDVYATSAEGGIFRFDGTSWTAETSGSIERLNAVFGTSASAVYVAGGSFQVATILAGAPAAVPTAPPTVTTTNPGTIGSTTVVMGGNVTADGGGPVVERGIVWGTAANPTTSNNKFAIGSGMSSFSGTVTGLPPTTTVFARAFARNSLFTGYGAETSFVTLSNNADLSALTTTAGALSPAFAANVTSYTASVPNATTSVTVTPTVALANATVTVNSVSVTSGSPSGAIALNLGSNVITTTVTAQDTSITKTYTLTVTRAAPVLAGDPITPTAVIVTSQWVGPIAGVRANMIDGSGLSGGGSVLTQTHDNVVTANTMWHAGPDAGDIVGGVTGPPPFGAPPVNTQAVEFDLGANYDLSGAHIWNMNQVGSIGRGVKDVQILISSATTGAFTALTTAQFTQGTGATGLAAQVVPLTGATNVRRVRFSIQTAWSGAVSDYVGLSEVRFQGTPYTVTPAPTLTSVSPATGSTAGGTSVTLTGTNFTGATGVTFGGAAATAFTVDSATTITATTPAGTAGTASVLVTTAGGTNAANSLFTYMAPNTDLFELKVRYFDPGPNLIPFDKAVTSYTLDATETVIAFSASPEADPGATLEYQWNGAAYTPLTSGVATLKSLATTGANTLLVRVTNGTAQKVYTVNITYTPPAPTLTSVAPATGSTLGGTSVTLTGTNFTGATGVTFGGTAATAFTVDSATQITATTPAHAAGAVSVIVTTPGGSNAANTLFTYGVGNTAPIIRNAFGLELPAALTLDHAENIAFSDTLLVTDANSGQNHTWALSGHDAAKFTVHPTTGAFALANTLDFENHTDHDMNGVYEVTVTVTDSGTPAMSDSIALSFTIQNDNDAPTVSAIAAQTTDEDTPKTIAFTLADQDAGDLDLLTITAFAENDTLIPDDNLAITGSGASRTLTLTPAADLSGSTIITVAVDDGENPIATADFTLTVTAVNDAPSLTLAPSIARFPGGPAFTQPGMVTDISPGPADEGGQTVTLSLTSITNTAIFTVQPTLSASGSLSFTPGANPGLCTVTVRATDSGAAFTEQTFTITISAFKPGADGEVWTPRMADGNRNWWAITSSADGSKLAAVVDGDQLYTSTDSGVTWTARLTEVARAWRSITSSADGSKLAAVVAGGKIYTSTDSGVTWTARESNRSWISITSSADGSKLAAVVYGGKIYTSTDSGVTWTARESNRLWYSISSSADGSKLAAVVYGGQIYTSTDSGVTWEPRLTDVSRLWQSITSSADGSKLAAVVLGGQSGGQIYTSTDSGVTWTARESNRKWASITSSADGSKLAAVVFGGQIYTSTDSGVTWTARESNRSWRSITSSADGSKLAAADGSGVIYTSEGRGLPEVAAGRALTVASFTTAEAGNGVVSYTVTNTNPALFAVQPAIALDGTLSLTAGQAAGTATVSVTVNFAGGATTPPQTFPIQVIKRRKVQQQILFFLVDAPAEQYRRIAAGETFVGVFRATLNDNPSDLPLVLSGPDAALFQLDPVTDSLDFITVPSFAGDRVYDVTLSVGSPTSVNGMATARIRITDKEVNVMPSFTKGADLTNLPATVAPQTIPGWATAISDGDAAVTQALTFSFRAISGENLLSVPPAIDPATGNLTFTPSGIAGGTARYAVTLTDDASINGTSALTTAEETFDITFTLPGVQTRQGDTVDLDLSWAAVGTGQTLRVTGLPPGLTFTAGPPPRITGRVLGPAPATGTFIQVMSGTVVIRTLPLNLPVASYIATGSYELLLEEVGQPTGRLRVTVSNPTTAAPNPAFSATLDRAGAAQRKAAGTFTQGDLPQTVRVTFPAVTTTPAVSFDLLITSGSDLVTAATFPSSSLTGRGFRLARSSRQPVGNPVLTLTLPPAVDGDRTSTPAGIGWARGTVGTAALVSLAGQLGDAQAFISSLSLSQTNQAVVWMTPYTNKASYLGGIINLADTGAAQRAASTDAAVTGLQWRKLADATSTSYPAGFGPLALGASSSRWVSATTADGIAESLGLDFRAIETQYIAPAAGILPTRLSLRDNFALLRLAPDNAVPFTGKITTTGGFTGSLTLAAPATKSDFSGVLLQEDSFGSLVGQGLIKVPVTSAVKGSYETVGIRLRQPTSLGTHRLRIGGVANIDLSSISLASGETLRLNGLPPGLALTGSAITGTVSGLGSATGVTIQVMNGKIVVRTLTLDLAVEPYAIAGRYEVLLENGGLPAGKLQVTVTSPTAKEARAAFTAVLDRVGETTRRTTGFFTASAASPLAVTIVFPAIKTVPAVTYVMPISSSSNAVTATTSPASTVTARGFRLARAGHLPVGVPALTMTFPTTVPGNRIHTPGGIGHARGTISTAGAVSLAGTLGDGQAFTSSLNLAQTNQAVVWVTPYTNKASYLGGIVSLATPATPDRVLAPAAPASSLKWTRIADAKALSYPAGFGPLDISAISSRWMPTTHPIPLAESLGLSFRGINLSYIAPTTDILPRYLSLRDTGALITISPSNAVPFTKGTTVGSNGSFSATLALPAPAQASLMNGVFLQDPATGNTIGQGLIRVPTSTTVKGSFQTMGVELQN